MQEMTFFSQRLNLPCLCLTTGVASAAVAAQAAQEVALGGDGNKSWAEGCLRAQSGLCARGRAQEGQVLDPSWELRNYTSARLLPWRDL